MAAVSVAILISGNVDVDWWKRDDGKSFDRTARRVTAAVAEPVRETKGDYCKRVISP